MRKNTRQYRRFSFVPVAFLRGQKQHGLGQALELSLSGIAVFTPADFDFGQPVEMRLPVPQSAKTLRVTAVARNKTGERWGFEFTSLRPMQVSALRAACRVLGMREARD
jgi:PilZ domain-containing protein